MTSVPLCPLLMLYYQLVITDQQGRVIRRTRVRRSRSLLRQWIELLRVRFTQEDQAGVRNIAGALVTIIHASTVGMLINGGAGDANRGPVAGGGSAPVDIADFRLGALIPNGTGAGQLAYAATSFSGIVVDATSAQFTVSRIFNNQSGGPVTIREVGIHAQNNISGQIQHFFLIVRDLVSPAETVPSGGAATLVYTVRVVE